MVRLVITDFATREDNESFYSSDEFETYQKMFTYNSFKQHSVYLSRYETSDELYSLNLLSKKHLSKNQFLIHIADGEYYILFNHKTVYSAKINHNFITDDMIKSILITRHIAMLSSGGDIDKIYYLVNSRYKSAIENILKENTRNEKNEIIAKSLGDVEDLLKPLNELDTYKSHFSKSLFTLVFIGGIIWLMAFGLEMATKKIFYKESLQSIKREINIEERLAKRQKIILRTSLKKYNNIAACITKEEIKK